MSLRSLQNIKFTPIKSDSQRLTVFRFGDISDIGRLAGSRVVAGFYIPRLGGSDGLHARLESEELQHRPATRCHGAQTARPISIRRACCSTNIPTTSCSSISRRPIRAGTSRASPKLLATIDLKHRRYLPPRQSAAVPRSEALFGELHQCLGGAAAGQLQQATGEDIYAHYTVGWLLNHYLTFEPSREGQLKQYLRSDQRCGHQPAHGRARRRSAISTSSIGEFKPYKSGRLPGVDVPVRPTTRPPQVDDAQARG